MSKTPPQTVISPDAYPGIAAYLLPSRMFLHPCKGRTPLFWQNCPVWHLSRLLLPTDNQVQGLKNGTYGHPKYHPCSTSHAAYSMHPRLWVF